MFTVAQRRILDSHVTTGIKGDCLFKGKSHFSAKDFESLFLCKAFTLWNALKMFFILLDVPLKSPLKFSLKKLSSNILRQEIEEYFWQENSEDTIQPLIKSLRIKYCCHSQKGDNATEAFSIDQVYYMMRGKLGIDLTHGNFMNYIIRNWPANKQISFKCYHKFDPLLVKLFCEICLSASIVGSGLASCGGRQWWNNFQIDQVQARLQNKFPDDKFFILNKILLLNPKEQKNHHILLNPKNLLVQCFSISTGYGTHWCCLLFDGKEKKLFYLIVVHPKKYRPIFLIFF